MKNKRVKTIAVGLIMAMTAGLLITGCGQKTAPNDINIAVAGPMSRMEGEFTNGIELAQKEIKASGYSGDRAVNVKYFDDKRDLTTGIKIAQNLAKEATQYTAVIGHWNASINIPASTIYNDAGLTAITPMVSASELTASDLQYIFRAIPSDAAEANRVAEYAKEKGYNKIAICYTDSDYGKGLCGDFETACKENGITITDTHVDFINQNEFDNQYERWTALGTQAIFIANSMPYASEITEMIRGKSQTLPILSAGGFSSEDVITLLGAKSNNISYVSIYNPYETGIPTMTDFNKKYKEAYGKEPVSYIASKGYELVYLIVDAVNECGSTASSDIKDYLHNMDNRQGVLDKYKFEETGEPSGMQLYVVEIKNGQYYYSI